MIHSVIISILMLFVFQIGVTGSIKILHLYLISDGYYYSDQLQIWVLYGIGQLISVLLFNNLLRKVGFLRLFISCAIIITMILLTHFLYFSMFSLQLLSPILSCTQTISFLCLVDLLAPVLNSKIKGSFSIINQIVKAVSLLIPTIGVFVEDIRVVLCIMILFGILLFLCLDINVLLKDYELRANVSDIYKNYNGFFWSCFFFKIAEIIFSTFFILSLKISEYNIQQSFWFSSASFLGRIIIVILISINKNIVNNYTFIIYLGILMLSIVIHYYKIILIDFYTLGIILLLYGGFLTLNRIFLTKLLRSHVNNLQKRLSISQTQYHIEYTAAIIGYISGSLLLYKGLYGIVLGAILNHLISWFFMWFTIDNQ